MSSNLTAQKGNQEPRIKLEPPREDTDGQDAADLAAALGLTPDPWQRLILDAWLGRDIADNFTATTCGVAVPRQNGKNAILEMRELYGLCILGETILHTAHEVKTAALSFRRLQGFFTDDSLPEFKEMSKAIRRTNGQEAIELINGGEIRFSARSRGASRGFTTDLVVFDEAQELTDEQIEATLSTMAAAPSGNRQLILTGTPPGPSAPGTVFPRTRRLVLDGDATHTAWHEWSVEDIGDITDRKRWYETNPAMGIRLTEEFTETEFQHLTEAGFARERLGWWTKTSSKAAITQAAWDACATAHPPKDGTVSYGVKFAPDGINVSLAVCLRPETESPHVELVDSRSTYEGVSWLAEWLIKRKDKAASIVIDGRSGADALFAALRGNISPRALKACASRDVIAASTMFYNAIKEKNITHFAQEQLDDAAYNACKRPIGNDGGYGWGATNEIDITPLEAVTLAYYGAMTTMRKPGRRAKIL